MSEESKVIYCTGCGSENPESSKFCSNCGNKLENPMQPVYEQIEAEILESNEAVPMPEPEAEAAVESVAVETPVEADPVVESSVYESPAQEELNIHYEVEDSASEPIYQSAEPQYYSSGQSATPVNQSNGNIGFSIASMVCGILSLLCCCTSFLSLLLAIGAVVLGVIAIKNNYEGKGMAIAGLITGGIGILLTLAVIILGGFSDFFVEALDDLANY